jgi:hypothetical protein
MDSVIEELYSGNFGEFLSGLCSAQEDYKENNLSKVQMMGMIRDMVERDDISWLYLYGYEYGYFLLLGSMRKGLRTPSDIDIVSGANSCDDRV